VFLNNDVYAELRRPRRNDRPNVRHDQFAALRERLRASQMLSAIATYRDGNAAPSE